MEIHSWENLSDRWWISIEMKFRRVDGSSDPQYGMVWTPLPIYVLHVLYWKDACPPDPSTKKAKSMELSYLMRFYS